MDTQKDAETNTGRDSFDFDTSGRKMLSFSWLTPLTNRVNLEIPIACEFLLSCILRICPDSRRCEDQFRATMQEDFAHSLNGHIIPALKTNLNGIISSLAHTFTRKFSPGLLHLDEARPTPIFGDSTF